MGAGFRVTTTLMLYQSYLYIPTGMATTLHFLYPALTALLCRARFRERLGPWKLFALGLSGLGALCLWSWAPEQIQGESSWPPPQL